MPRVIPRARRQPQPGLGYEQIAAILAESDFTSFDDFRQRLTAATAGDDRQVVQAVIAIAAALCSRIDQHCCGFRGPLCRL